jgi:hypothetical protein
MNGKIIVKESQILLKRFSIINEEVLSSNEENVLR